MQIVLRSDVDKVGNKGDIINVADGYARNFLIPRGHAIAATKGITAQARSMRAAREKHDAKARENAQQVAAKLVAATLKIDARTGSEGKLFGSVTNADVVEAVRQQLGIEIDRRQIDLHDPIRSVGEHDVPVKLHADVQITVKVEVVPAD